MSLSTLKRRLRHYGVKRRGAQIEDQELREILLREISGPGQLRGYRAMWHSLRLKHHIHLPRERVAYFIQELNPDGTRERRRSNGDTSVTDPISAGMLMVRISSLN